MATSYIPEQPVHLDRPYSHDIAAQNTASLAVQNAASSSTAPSTSYSQHDSHVIPYPRCQMAGGSGVDNTTPSVLPLDPNSVGGHLDTLPADIRDWGLFTGGIVYVHSAVISIVLISLRVLTYTLTTVRRLLAIHLNSKK